jgi:hypothetical protein
MPNGSGGTYDVSGDINYMFGRFNAVPAPSPFFYMSDYWNDSVFIFDDDLSAEGWAAVTYMYNTETSAPYYGWGQLILSNASSWGSSSSNRGALCHEIDHIMGLWHVWQGPPLGPDNVGSKATCIGYGWPTGPSIDDVSALNAVYTNAAP